MKVSVVGGGPAGLYFSYLLKRDQPGCEVLVIEQNPSDATFGFGVVFSDNALEFLHGDDEDTYQYLRPRVESWLDLLIVHKDEPVLIDGNGFAAIGRLEFLRFLHSRCEQVGVKLSFGKIIQSLDQVPAADLVVAADGVNSVVRRTYKNNFGTTESWLNNSFIWYGTTKPFDCLSLTFRETVHGVFCAHHYRYSQNMSTFIVETDVTTFSNAGFENLSEKGTRAYCQDVFAPDLSGHPLVSNNSVWRRFPQIWNRLWSLDNVVLLGDASHTAHFSIGSGTRLAMEDAIALFKAIKAHPDDQMSALAHYENVRRPTVEKLVDAATRSAQWYEQMATTIQTLDPYDFARSYMTRTGRVNNDRLIEMAPKFMARYQDSRSR